MRVGFWTCVAIVWAGVVVVYCLFVVTLLGAMGAFARYDERYASTDPAVQQWYRSQRVPGGQHIGTSCCDIADGVHAQEDIRGGEYWVTYVTREGIESGWQKVDSETQLIKGPNTYGHTVVWYIYVDAKPQIRCFIPGAGI